MIEFQTIVCFASGYDAPPTSKHHVMHWLARRNRVLWVNYHASRRPSASAADLRHMAGRVRRVLGGLKNPAENLYVLTPPVVPLPASKTVRAFNRAVTLWSIRRALGQMQNGPVQIWSFAPDVAGLLGRLNETRTVYYCVDDFASFSGYERKRIVVEEEQLCRRSDLVVATSRALWEAKRRLNHRTILVTHGVEYDHFAKAARVDLPAPPEMAAIPRPRIGFFGLIRDWVDLELVSRVAQTRPDWHFVFLGGSGVSLEPYRRPNLHFLGPRSYAELPAYCRQFDVGMIPFVLNDLTRAANPIKLREYLAAGLPVVSTPLPEVDAYRPLVRVGATPVEFAAAIESSLSCEETRAVRSACMAGEAWPAKLERICKCLESVSISGSAGQDVLPAAFQS